MLLVELLGLVEILATVSILRNLRLGNRDHTGWDDYLGIPSRLLGIPRPKLPDQKSIRPKGALVLCVVELLLLQQDDALSEVIR